MSALHYNMKTESQNFGETDVGKHYAYCELFVNYFLMAVQFLQLEPKRCLRRDSARMGHFHLVHIDLSICIHKYFMLQSSFE
jgi:hypothetical protein